MERVFRDRDGVEWQVSWRPAEAIAQIAGGGEEVFHAGLEFTTNGSIRGFRFIASNSANGYSAAARVESE